MDIIKIMIKGASDYGSIDDGYEDKVTLTESSFSYKYKPYPKIQSEMNTDTAKVFVFENMESLIPVTDAENVPLP